MKTKTKYVLLLSVVGALSLNEARSSEAGVSAVDKSTNASSLKQKGDAQPTSAIITNVAEVPKVNSTLVSESSTDIGGWQKFRGYSELSERLRTLTKEHSGWDDTDFYTIYSTDGQSARDVFLWTPFKFGHSRVEYYPGLSIHAHYSIDNNGPGQEDYSGFVILKIMFK